MPCLPLANLLHHKLRSLLSAAGIGIGVCMLVTLTGLSRGSLYEVAERWESVDADLILLPRGCGDNAADKSGSGLHDAYAARLLAEHGDLIERVVPVFTWQMRLAGQDHMAAGVEPNQWQTLSGGRELIAGRLFDPNGSFARWLEGELAQGGGDSGEAEIADLAPDQLAHPAHNGLELVIDSRLARAAGLRVGQTVTSANHTWRVVGIAPAGVMTRVFLPRRTAQFLFGSGDLRRSTLMFVKLRAGRDSGPAARKIRHTTGQDVVPLKRYRGMLVEKFGILFVYVDMVNAVALAIAFLFIMTTLYTMVLQRTREIAILKSCGASDGFILRLVLAESLVLTGAGTALGVAMSFAAAWSIEAVKPLLTVTITARWIAVAIAASAAGAVLSGLYPAWRAMRVDVVEALTLE